MNSHFSIFICPDSFKGSLSASTVTDIIADEFSKAFPDISIIKMPLADGGEGTSEALNLSDDSGKTVFIESARYIGLPLYSEQQRNPLKLSSWSLGKEICRAVSNNAEQIIVSLGGSATCDAGMGMLSALGFVFLDKNGNHLEPSGENMSKIYKVDDSRVLEGLSTVRFTVITDVDNPLTGVEGSAEVFAPQKGATPQDIPILEKGLEKFAEATKKSGYASSEDIMRQGAGAAGGLGYAFMTYLKARSFKGIDFVMEQLNFDSALHKTDLIITGEGKVDRQSLMGKVVSGVLRKASSIHLPVIVFAGLVEDKDLLLEAGIQDVIPIANPELSHEQNLQPSIASENLRIAVRDFLKKMI